jgi:hypothetical protein
LPNVSAATGSFWRSGSEAMLDVVFVAATAAFFAMGILYVRGCERLK